MKFKTVDLCAGIGGIRRGFEMTGYFENILSVEIDKYARKTYEHLYNEKPEEDLTSEEFKEKMRKLEYDILLAGFPCQTFSRAGKREGFLNNIKGTIFFHIAQIIEETEPKAIFLENVDHLITHNKGETFRTIIEVLANKLDYKIVGVKKGLTGDLIYNPKDFIRNSKNFGVPQNRPRVYIVGFSRNKLGNSVDVIDDFLPNSRKMKIYQDLHDVLEMNAEPKYFISSGYFETLEKHRERQKRMGNGFGYCIINKPETNNPIANTLLATGGSGKERNLIFDTKAKVAGITVKGKQSPINDKNIRVMTPKEWGKLQGFINYAFLDENGNDLFSFPVGISDVQKYKQFGNSVTIPVIEEMAKFIKEWL